MRGYGMRGKQNDPDLSLRSGMKTRGEGTKAIRKREAKSSPFCSPPLYVLGGKCAPEAFRLFRSLFQALVAVIKGDIRDDHADIGEVEVKR